MVSPRTVAHHFAMNDWPPASVEWIRCVRTVHLEERAECITVRCQDTFGHEGSCTVIDPATFESVLVPAGATW
jgi:hypothetical protein